ncbi:MAG: hypothetical protein ACE5E9_07490 [Nitrospinaceae bacterium]
MMDCHGKQKMGLEEQRVVSVRVLDIMEESAGAIEKMVNKAIDEIYEDNKRILDIQTTGDNLILILGEKKS